MASGLARTVPLLQDQFEAGGPFELQLIRTSEDPARLSFRLFFPRFLPTFLDGSLLEQRMDHASSIVVEQANDVAEVQLVVEKQMADLNGMRALEV